MPAVLHVGRVDREAVRRLLAEDRRLARVMPRYFDARDPAGAGLELDDGLPHDDCDYFAVYGCTNPFSREELRKHEVIPFSAWLPAMPHLYTAGSSLCVAATKQRAARLLEVPMIDVRRFDDNEELLCSSELDDDGVYVTAAEVAAAWGEECLIPDAE